MSEIILRDYQSASIESLRQGFRDGHKRQVLCAATGAGKSVIMLSMIESAIKKKSKAMFICERRVLVDQFSQHLDSARIPHGVLMAKHWRYRPYENIQVASAQTLERMKNIPEADIIFIDEVHVGLRKSVIGLLTKRPDVKVIGATATPFNPIIGQHFTSVTSVTTMEKLVEEKHLVPFRVFVATEIDTEGLKVVAGEWQKDELEKRGQQIVGDVVADYVRISHEVFGQFEKTICFSCGIKHGAELVTKFAEVGINAVQISSNDEDTFRKEALEEFKKPDSSIQVLISVQVLSRGFDQADVKHVIIARPLKKSFSEHVQMVGRGARPHHSKTFAVVQDNSGNWLRFKDDWDKLYSEGVTDLIGGQDAKERKEPTEQQKKDAKCGKCGCVMPPGTDTCPQCGAVRVSRSTIVNLPGVMQEIEGSSAKAEKQAWWSGLLFMANARGKERKWCLALFQKRFKSWPNGLSDNPAEPTMEMASWEHSRRIAWAKSKFKRKA